MQLSHPQQELHHSLLEFLRQDQVSFTTPDRLSYGRDSNSKAILWVKADQMPYPPDAVVWPETREEIARILRFAQKERIPVVPFGGGSGVCGGTWALRGGIALDLKRMDRILKVDTKEMTVTAQSGINGEILERELKRRGLTLGHFPSSIYSATLGGYLACRSAGQFSTQYGKIEDMVEEMEVVLARGEILSLKPPQRGLPNLQELFLGSEGTLGVITQATLRVHPQPEAEIYLGFNFSSLEAGLDGLREILQSGLTPCVVRLYDELDTRLAGSYSEMGTKPWETLSRIFKPAKQWLKAGSFRFLLKKPGWLQKTIDLMSSQCMMIIGFQGIKALVDAQVRGLRAVAERLKAQDLGEGPGRHWLQHRYSVSYKLSPLFDQGIFADTMEVATTWTNLLPLYRAIRGAISPHALVLAHFSHAYHEGCSIYFTFVASAGDESQSEELYDRIWEKALDACSAAGGTISHHHGIGVLKAAAMPREWGDAFSWLCQVKRNLDPKGILNPGKLGFSIGEENS